MIYITTLKALQVDIHFRRKVWLIYMNNAIIVGGGASGLFTAIYLSKPGCDVTVIEACDKPGKKILMTGNGRCNLSTTSNLNNKYYCEDKDFINKVFNHFSNNDIVNEFQKMGLAIKEKGEGLYPYSLQASSVADCLISYCRLCGVKFLLNTIVTDFEVCDNNSFKVNTLNISNSDNSTYYCNKLFISVGSKAGLKEDYSYNLIQPIKKYGHTFNEYFPALCSLYVNKKTLNTAFFKNAAGVRCEINSILKISNQLTHMYHGELQITDYGLSGIVIFQFSRNVAYALNQNKKCEVVIDFIPNIDTEDIVSAIESQDYYSQKSVLDILSGLLNKKLSMELINLYSKKINTDIKPFSKNIEHNDLYSIISFCKSVGFEINKTNDYIHSQVCAGGIGTNDINPDTMESKLIKNLYFTGECINVDGLCGGYNLQWAWSTGYVAGNS